MLSVLWPSVYLVWRNIFPNALPFVVVAVAITTAVFWSEESSATLVRLRSSCMVRCTGCAGVNPARVWIGVLWLSFGSSLYSGHRPWSNVPLANFICHSGGYLFYSVDHTFDAQNFLNFHEVQFVFLLLLPLPLLSHPRNHGQIQCPGAFLLHFLLSFIVSGLTFRVRFLTYFELSFVSGIK